MIQSLRSSTVNRVFYNIIKTEEIDGFIHKVSKSNFESSIKTLYKGKSRSKSQKFIESEQLKSANNIAEQKNDSIQEKSVDLSNLNNSESRNPTLPLESKSKPIRSVNPDGPQQTACKPCIVY
jgi:hypothetical protein